MAGKNSHVIVRQRHPLLAKLVYVLAAGTVLLLVWLAFDYGRARAGFDSHRAEQQHKVLLGRIAHLQEKNDALRQKNAILIQAREVDRQAYAEVEQSLSDQQDEIHELHQEVAFYQGIVSPNESSRGLRVQSFGLDKNHETGTYHYDVVLTQFSTRNRVISGAARVSIEGMQGDQKKSLRLDDIVLGGKSNMNFRFKFFQRLEGDFALPDDFVPLMIKIRVVPNGRRHGPVEKSWGWQELTT